MYIHIYIYIHIHIIYIHQGKWRWQPPIDPTLKIWISEGGMIRSETLIELSNLSNRVVRAYPLIELRQTAPRRAIRGNCISVNSALPPSYSKIVGSFITGFQTGSGQTRGLQKCHTCHTCCHMLSHLP